MTWTYRVFRDQQGRYSIREIFCEQNHTIAGYGKVPVALVGGSLQELIQLVQWFKEAFDLPVLSLEEIDAQIAKQETKKSSDHGRNISLKQVMTELATEE